MSRRIDLNQPLSEDDLEYLAQRSHLTRGVDLSSISAEDEYAEEDGDLDEDLDDSDDSDEDEDLDSDSDEEEDEDDEIVEDDEDLEELSIPELRALALEREIEVPKKALKSHLIELLS